MDGKCKFYKKANEIEEAEYFICKLPNLDSETAKLKAQCQGDINMCDNLEEYVVCSKGFDTPK